jgi:hypothetical protein
MGIPGTVKVSGFFYFFYVETPPYLKKHDSSYSVKINAPALAVLF